MRVGVGVGVSKLSVVEAESRSLRHASCHDTTRLWGGIVGTEKKKNQCRFLVEDEEYDT